jgi:hypothetical protein
MTERQSFMRYCFRQVRAGESWAESFGEPLTNPVWKTSERHGLSKLGKEQVTHDRAHVAAAGAARPALLRAPPAAATATAPQPSTSAGSPTQPTLPAAGVLAQVLRGLVADAEALGACTDGCWLWPSITQVRRWHPQHARRAPCSTQLSFGKAWTSPHARVPTRMCPRMGGPRHPRRRARRAVCGSARQNAYQTAELMSYVLGLTRNRIIPEVVITP